MRTDVIAPVQWVKALPCSGDNVTAIALPAIGAGLGGLKWDDVKAVLNKVSNDYPNVDLYVVETYQSE